MMTMLAALLELLWPWLILLPSSRIDPSLKTEIFPPRSYTSVQ